MSSSASRVRTLILRVLGLAVVLAILVTQLRWNDSLQTVEGGTLEGHVERLEDGRWRVTSAEEAVTTLSPEAVAVRESGGGEVPAVSWGIRSMIGRLGGHPSVALEVLLLLFTTYLITGWRWQKLSLAAGVDLTLGQATRLNLIGAFFNTAVPGSTGGDVVKAWYAARTTGRGVRAVLAVFTDRLVGLVGLAVFSAGAILLLGSREGLGTVRWIIGLALLGLLGGSAVMLSTRLRRWLGLGQLARKLPFHGALAEVGAALRLYREQPRALLLALGVSLVNHALAGFAVFLLARALDVQGVELGMALALVPIANLFGAIPLLPGGWGVGELAFAYLFGQVGVPATEAISLSVVYRLGMLATSLPGGVLWLFWRGRPSRETITHDVEVTEKRLEAYEQVAEASAEARLGAAPEATPPTNR